MHEIDLFLMYYVAESSELSYSDKLDFLTRLNRGEDLVEFVVTATAIAGAISTAVAHGTKWTLTKYWPHIGSDLKNQIKKNLGMQTDLSYKIRKATGPVKKALEDQLENLKDGLEQLIKTAKENPVGAVATTAIVAAALAASVIVYKKYLSKAARSCKNSPDKEGCMEIYRDKALRAKINVIQKEKMKCKKGRDPSKCNAKLEDHIHRLTIKMRKNK